MSYKELFSLISIVLTLVSFYPYIVSIKKGETKPHYFSWIIWGLTTTLSSFTELADDGGVGAYSVLIGGIICFYIAYLAYKQKRDYVIDRGDWISFYIALGSLVIWYITSTPLWTAIILTIVDSIGFIPTFKKSYNYPWEEHIGFYILITVKNLFAIVAMENYTITTTFFLWIINILSIIFIFFLLWRRKVLSRNEISNSI
jgi:hypothetical protein